MTPREDLIAELSKLGYAQHTDSSRLIGMVVALAAEVFVMKAQNECLRRALIEGGTTTVEQLTDASASEGLQKWMAAEERAFTRALLAPLLEGDASINAVAEMART